MKYADLFNECRSLIYKYGYTDDYGTGSIRDGVYLDPVMRNLQIKYSSGDVPKDGKVSERICVYFGGRIVYDCNSWHSEKEYFVSGNWYDYVFTLKQYHNYNEKQKTLFREYTLVLLCEKEGLQYSDFLKKYKNIFYRIIMRKGSKTYSNIRNEKYEYEIMSDELDLKMYFYNEFCRDYEELNGKSISVFFQKELVFSYGWDGCAGGFWDKKGIYKPGPWEAIAEKMYSEL